MPQSVAALRSAQNRVSEPFFNNINIFLSARTPLQRTGLEHYNIRGPFHCVGFIYFIGYVKLADRVQAFFAYDYNSLFDVSFIISRMSI